jgi:ribosomal protein S21
MAVQIDITPHKNENAGQTLRRFSNAFREAGIMHTVKGRRYHKRKASVFVEKHNKLRRIADALGYKSQRRMGKIS